jgi:P-type Cu2+ transporter
MITHPLCGPCPLCTADVLSVTCGATVESHQFEYDFCGTKASHKAAGAKPHLTQVMEQDIKKRFWIATILTLFINLYTHAGDLLPTILPSYWLVFLLTTLVVGAGSIFIKGAYYSLKARQLNASVLIATGIVAAYSFGVLATLTQAPGAATSFEAAAMLITFALLGHWLEMKARRGTSNALRGLFTLVPPQAVVLRDDKEVTVSLEDVAVGDTVLIKPGDKIPVDGTVTKGESTVDESLITGESALVDKNVGDKVIGGSINRGGSFEFLVSSTGKGTTLARIIELVEHAQMSKAPGQRLADKAAGYLVVIAIASGIATFLGWYVIGLVPAMVALTYAISAIVVACPDALGLATPTAVAVGTGLAARHYILIKDAETLEQASRIQTIIFDKTGTLTEGKPTVEDTISAPGTSPEEMLYWAASAQKLSNHPFSKAVVDKAAQRSITLSSSIKHVQAIAGHGLLAEVDGRQVIVGNQALMKKYDISLASLHNILEQLVREAKTVSIVALDGTAIGMISVIDPIRASARDTIKRVEALGIETVMISGDNAPTAHKVAREVGIQRVFAPVLPEEKAAYVQKLQKEHRFVAMVGDGINDAPALAQADIGIAIGAGTDVARASANIILMRSDPEDIVTALELSKATVRTMKQNLFWAAGYNLLAIPVASGILHKPWELILTPEIAVLLMSLSSIIVVANAILLTYTTPR